ncbi:MAG: aldose 1-epimerase family protein [Armatimonadetes bacterium]|nr:aldose 1-epimerase family protein [Armatimonadota bacterium]
MRVAGKTYSRARALERVGNLRQLGGARHVVLNDGRSKGVAAIDVDTGAGLHFTVLPDRGLDISAASYRGTNLVYLTPNGEVNPAFYEPRGMGWLRTFFGGLLTTCGLTYLGPPGRDGDEDLGLHGRATVTPARQVCDRSGWEGDEYRIEISGIVEECALFGDKLRLTRTITTHIGSKALMVRDRVENFGYASSPFTILYHVNPGFPLLDAASELVLSAAESSPCDPHSARGLGAMRRFTAPVPGFQEENFLHRMAADGEGWAHAALINRELQGGLGLSLRFDAAALPYLNEWKMMGQGDYVVGIEPCNAPCENRALLREQGLLPFLEPGDAREMRVGIGVLEGEAEIAAFAKTTDRLSRE